MNDLSMPYPVNPAQVRQLHSPANRLESRLQSIRGAAPVEAQKSELRKVAQEFEAIFIAQMLKVMRETIEESGLLEGGFGKSIYTELFDQEVSLSLARRGTLGISNILYDSLSQRPEPEQEPDSSPRAGEPAAGVSRREPAPGVGEGRGTQDEITDMQLPVSAPVSSSFGMRRDPFSHRRQFHRGLDLSAPEGMKVVPALEGTVVFAGARGGYGNLVVVRHSPELETRYAHLGSIEVKAGDLVGSQDVLGTVGSSGRSTGPHLHFEVLRQGIAIDPAANLSLSFFGGRNTVSKPGV